MEKGLSPGIFPVSTFRNPPVSALPSLTKYLGQIHVKRRKMGDLPRFMVQSSAESDIQGCRVPGNHASTGAWGGAGDPSKS